MNLNAKQIKLTELTWDDLPLIHELNSRVETDQFNTLGIPTDIEATREVIRAPIESMMDEPRRKYAWVIRSLDGEFVGEIGLNIGIERYRRGEIFYSLLVEHWGKGFATQAVQSVINFGFESLQLHRIEAGVATGNQASIRVLEKAGMTREGLGRQILPIRGEWVDNYAYSILEDDPRPYKGMSVKE